MAYTHLHVHSHYSLLDGLPKIDELISHAKKLGFSSCALTDHGTMYGVIEFFQKATAAGLKPIIGVETYVARRSRLDREPGIDEKPYHLILLAKNDTGYKNLIKLITKAHHEGFYYKPRVDWELLERYHDGLIATSACLAGEIAQTVLNSGEEATKAVINKFQKVFGSENFFLEVQPLDNNDQRKVNATIFKLSESMKVPVIATNDVHYLSPEDAEAQDILLCIQTKKLQSDTARMSYVGQNLSMKSEDEMRKAFPDHPEVCDNTQKIADRCSLELQFGTPLLPHFPLPENITPDSYLEQLCLNAVKARYPETWNKKEIKDRLAYELQTIKQTGFASYFLIVHDFVDWAKKNNIVVGPGRGSAAGSIVSFVLNITNVDPIKYELLFERFLNPERISMPDIDLDFADTRRDEVIRYVEEKYGKDHVAQIITFGTMAARAAVRDVGRVLGLPYSYCDRIAKLIPMFTSLDEALSTVNELKEVMRDSEGEKLLTMAKKLEGVARHSSTHACGVIITKEPLDHYVPTQYASASDNTIISQYSLHPIEDLGILKMDFLGLKNLTIIEQTLDIIKKARGLEINMDTIPLNDAASFKLLQEGKTVGVFQLESSGMRRYLKELKPTSLEDIIAMVSLYRPGPMEFIPDFIAGKHGKKKLTYLHPKLEPILSKTYGIIVYQEQVMQIARDIAGFTFGQADVLRKAVGKKIKKLLDEQRDKLINGMVDHGITKQTASKLWSFIEPFARYGFNRAHAACYAIIAYQTAYLKTRYPDEFMAALLTSDLQNIDRIAIEVEEAKEMGISVLPPDINESYTTFTAVFDQAKKEPTKKIRFGLLAIKNIGENIVRTIVHERKSHGNFEKLEDFLKRVQTKDLNKKSLQSLIESGALDRFGERKQLLINMETLIRYIKQQHEDEGSRQSSLFGSRAFKDRPIELSMSEPATKKERLHWEKQLLGLYISEHPVRRLHAMYGKKVQTIASILHDEHFSEKKTINLLGVIISAKKIITRALDPMLFVKFEDHTGSIEAIVFPKILKMYPTYWNDGTILMLQGRYSEKNAEKKFIVEQARVLQDDAQEIILKIGSHITKTSFAQIQEVLKMEPGPLAVRFVIENDSGMKTITTPFRVKNSPTLKLSLEGLVGKQNVLIE